MDRYQIAVGKKPDPKKEEKIHTFGFENNSLNSKELKFALFRPPLDSIRRVGIVYEDPSKLFVATNVHFHNRYFLCKSKNGRQEICCEKKGKPLFRMACVVIDYGIPKNNQELNDFQVLPWTFAKMFYKKLDDLHKFNSLHENDFILRRSPNDQFRNYEISALGGSIWRSSDRVDEIANMSVPIRNNMKKILGADLSDFEIRQLLEEPDRYNRRNQINRNISTFESEVSNMLDSI